MLGDWLDAADPGAVRRNHATRAALAALTAWLVVRTVVAWLTGRPMPSVALYAVTMCFIGALVIVDARRVERQVTQLLSIVMVAVGLFLASLLNGSEWYYRAVLLALIFACYAVRQRGLRPGELVLVLTMSLYFGEGSGVAWGNLAWFLFAAATGLLSLWLWQFVLLPYDPRRSLRNSVQAFYRRAAALVGAVDAELASAQAPLADDESAEKDLARRLRQVKLSRRVIEEQFPGALAPGGWSKAQLSQLQLALFNTEQGLARLVEGATDPAHLASIPAEIRGPLGRSLRSLQEALIAGSPESMAALAAEDAALQIEVRTYANAVRGDGRADSDAPPVPWVIAALRLISGSAQVAQSAGRVQRLAAAQGDAGPQTQAQAAVPAQAANRPASPRERLFGDVYVHPTTVLGIQAVVATGLAMLAARLLNVDHSNWVFWTAFSVIAGSTGESLRKMMLRVLGTVAGATIGVALALATPDNTILVAVVATACIFLTIYFVADLVSADGLLAEHRLCHGVCSPGRAGNGFALCPTIDHAARRAGRSLGGRVCLSHPHYGSVQSGRSPLSGRSGWVRCCLCRRDDWRRWTAPRRRTGAGCSGLRSGGTDIARRRVREQSDDSGAEPDHPASEPDHRAGGRGHAAGRRDIRTPHRRSGRSRLDASRAGSDSRRYPGDHTPVEGRKRPGAESNRDRASDRLAAGHAIVDAGAGATR